jgi:hypothetical protein
MQLIQYPSQSNVHNIRRDACCHFRNKKKAYLKTKSEELENNRKIKNNRDLYRVINDVKNGFQPRTRIENDEKGALVEDSHSLW